MKLKDLCNSERYEALMEIVMTEVIEFWVSEWIEVTNKELKDSDLKEFIMEQYGFDEKKARYYMDMHVENIYPEDLT